MAEKKSDSGICNSSIHRENKGKPANFTQRSSRQEQEEHSTIGYRKKTPGINSLRIEPSSSSEQDEFSFRRKWEEWQYELLLRLHSELGNKWAEIAQYFPEKPHSCIKNHFYARIRMAVRRINFFLRNQLPGKRKPIHAGNVSKMITLLSERKNTPPSLARLTIGKQQIFSKLKVKIFQFAKNSEATPLSQEEQMEMHQMVEKMNYCLEEVRKYYLVCKKKKDPQNLPKYRVNNQNASIKPQESLENDANVKIQQQEAQEEKVEDEIRRTQQSASQFYMNYHEPLELVYFIPVMPDGIYFFPYNNGICESTRRLS